MQNNKSVCIAFLGNPFFDSRVTNLSASLSENGCKVMIIGFDWQSANFETLKGSTSIYRLRKGKISLLFYLRFVFLLMIELMKKKADIYFAEDIYTLPFVKLFAKLRGAKIYYESRELYAFIGGLRNRKYVQGFIKSVERYFIKRVDLVITTGEMDSEFLEDYYHIKNTIVLRNLPVYRKPEKDVNLRDHLGIGKEQLILLYQGVLLDGRGISIILKAMADLPEFILVILGEGEKKEAFIESAKQLGVLKRVHFLGLKDQKELKNFTAAADIGLALIENISKSYYYALPNKLFEYIMAGIPVLCSNLPQMREVVDKYKVGECVDISEMANIISTLKKWNDDKRLLLNYKANCFKASEELNWQLEFDKVKNKLL